LLCDNPDELVGLKEKLELLLNKDVKITHRKLHHLSIEAMYDPIKMVELLNKHKEILLPPSISTPKKVLSSVKVFIKDSPKQEIQKVDTVPKQEIQKVDTVPKQEIQKVDTEKEQDDFLFDPKPINISERFSRKLPSFNENYEINSIENHNYTKWDPEHIKTLPDHMQLWINDFVIPSLEEEDTNMGISKNSAFFEITRFLQEFESKKTNEEQAEHVREMFDYISTSSGAIAVIIDHPKFANVMKNKILEIGNMDCKPFSICKPRTKNFIYAMTGIDF
jgi:hypothetical protein